MKLAMSVGDNRHYRMDMIKGRHFKQTVACAGLSETIGTEALDEIANTAAKALEKVKEQLPPNFPVEIHDSIEKAIRQRLGAI